MQVLKSAFDPSINFVDEREIGFIESRYVRRQKHYIIGYLSSQTGCNRGCKFCHLTTTGQTLFQDCSAEDFVDQAENVLEHYSSQNERADFINWNYMARGEPLCNPVITQNSQVHFQELTNLSYLHELEPRFNISTIIPKTLKKSLVDMFKHIKPTIYYSMYSVDPDFRNKWLPGAAEPSIALNLLNEYQHWSKQEIIIHGAFIKGENDSADSVRVMMDEIQHSGVRGRFNIVRYNPYSPEQGEETENYEEIISLIEERMPVKVIERVGIDVSASCGTFISS